jgi:cation transport ATPase
MRKIRQDLFWAFGYRTPQPIIAAAATALSSPSVIDNSAGLERHRMEVPS